MQTQHPPPHSPMAPPLPPPSSNHPNHHFFPLPHHKSNSNSCSLLFFKLILCSVFFLALPLFPSRPSETQSTTLQNHFWELLHLLFIGIAVSYGLFSRKNADFPISEASSHLDSSLSDWSSMFHLEESPHKAPSPTPDGFQNPSGYGETSVIQAWNSQYNQTQSMVVVANGHKSLGLPVRSLKSTVSDHGSGLSSDSSDRRRRRSRKFGDLGPTHFEEQSNEHDRALPSPISWRSRSGRMEVAEKVNNSAKPLSMDETQFESLKAQPFHFQSKARTFSQTPPSHSGSKMEDLRYKKMETSFATNSNSISFEFLSHSKMEDLRYNKMEMRDEMDDATSHAHFRPPSIDETECESHKSESFRSEASFSSNATSLYSPLHSNCSELPDSNIQEQPSGFARPSRMRQPFSGDETQFESFKPRPFESKASHSPSHSSSSDSSGSRNGALEKKKSFRGSSPPTMPTDCEECSNASLSERDLSGSEREFVPSSKDRVLNCVKPGRKAPAFVKASLRGKSVRTIRKQSDRGYDIPVPQLETRDQNCVPNPTFPRNQKSEKHKASRDFNVESEEDVESCDGKFRESSEEVEEQNVGKIESDARGREHDEVDKKASEFIAKFREQIRLQKSASVDISGELNINDEYFR